MPLYPLLVLEVGSNPQVPTFRNSTHLDPQVGLTKDSGARHKVGVQLGVIGFHPLQSPPFVKMCLTPKYIFLASWALALHIYLWT
jgi:hypothetical protein